MQVHLVNPPVSTNIILPARGKLAKQPRILEPRTRFVPVFRHNIVCILNHCNTHGQNDVNEEADVGVEVDFGKDVDSALGRDRVGCLHHAVD